MKQVARSCLEGQMKQGALIMDDAPVSLL